MYKWQAPTIGLIIAFLPALVFPSASVFAQPGPGLKTTTLTIDLNEVVGIELSTYSVGLGVGETIDDLSLTVEGSTLTDGVRTTPLSTLKP